MGGWVGGGGGGGGGEGGLVEVADGSATVVKGRVGKDGKEVVTVEHPTNALTHQLYTNILIY